jgi:hypothetical protein
MGETPNWERGTRNEADSVHIPRSAFVALVVLCLLPCVAHAADRLVLRDLSTIRSDVASFNADGLVLTAERPGGGKLVFWYEVESLELDDKNQQAEAIKLLEEIGLPLYRLRVRLQTGDDEGLLAPAAELYPVFRERRSVSALVVLQSLVWGRIAHGQREAAVEPWLREFELLRSRAAKVSDIPGSRKPGVDAASALLAELEPAWFDAEAAKTALPAAEKALQAMSKPVPPGAIMYVASLALAAGERQKSSEYLEEEIDSNNLAASLKQTLLAQSELPDNAVAAANRLQKTVAELEEAGENNEARERFLHPLALYWLGRAQLASDKPAVQQSGLLTLLRIPALEGRQSPELSAAALHEVAQFYAKDAPIATRLRREITQQFPGSWHARQRRATPTGAAR